MKSYNLLGALGNVHCEPLVLLSHRYCRKFCGFRMTLVETVDDIKRSEPTKLFLNLEGLSSEDALS